MSSWFSVSSWLCLGVIRLPTMFPFIFFCLSVGSTLLGLFGVNEKLHIVNVCTNPPFFTSFRLVLCLRSKPAVRFGQSLTASELSFLICKMGRYWFPQIALGIQGAGVCGMGGTGEGETVVLSGVQPLLEGRGFLHGTPDCRPAPPKPH